MGKIVLKDLPKSYGAVSIIKNINIIAMLTVGAVDERNSLSGEDIC